MKICFPVKEQSGLTSKVYNHFGSAPHFIIVDSDSKALEAIDNSDLEHTHGQCSPLKALNGKKIDILIVGGIGAGALNKLNMMGIKVFKSQMSTVEENLELLKEKKLSEMDKNDVCAGHGDGCSHN